MVVIYTIPRIFIKKKHVHIYRRGEVVGVLWLVMGGDGGEGERGGGRQGDGGMARRERGARAGAGRGGRTGEEEEEREGGQDVSVEPERSGDINNSLEYQVNAYVITCYGLCMEYAEKKTTAQRSFGHPLAMRKL